MRLFFTATKKSLVVALCAVSAVLSVALWYTSVKASLPDGSTHQKRMIFARLLKLSIDEEQITSKETVIPQSFGEVYSEYNELQKRAGFDLADYKGKAVTVYSCPIKGKEKNLTLIVYGGKIIGGDICETAINGEMLPIKYN